MGKPIRPGRPKAASTGAKNDQRFILLLTAENIASIKAKAAKTGERATAWARRVIVGAARR